MSNHRLRVAVLDDFEKIADTVPAYERLKARADVTILRQRLDTSEKLVAGAEGFQRLAAHARAHKLQRKRVRPAA